MMKKILSWFTKEELNVEPFYRSREVWTYQHTDPVTKRVSTRPVLIYRKASDGMFWGLLLTKTKVNGKVLYVPRLKNGKKVSALSQMRTLKASRLVHKIGEANGREFVALNNSIVRLLAASAPVPAKKVRAVQPRRPEYSVPSPFSPVYILQPR
ncbi:MAG: hypothetical protein WA021_02355 [Minisyncoccia bacterium]